MKQLTQFEVGFVMGLVVGEGCFTHDFGSKHGKRGKRRPVLSIKLTAEDRAPLDYTASLLGGKVYGPYRHTTKPYCVYLLRGLELREVVPIFTEYLPPSRKRAQFEIWLG